MSDDKPSDDKPIPIRTDDILVPAVAREHLVLGTTESGKSFFIEEESRELHTYICGKTGAGKTFFLASMILQDMNFGRPVCVLDPSGELYAYALNFAARCVDAALDERRHDVADNLEDRFLFLDIRDKDEHGNEIHNPLRVNPLLPCPHEAKGDVVNDLMKTIERLLGPFEEQRRIREVLHSVFRIAVELNCLPEERHRPLPRGITYPVGLWFAYVFLDFSDEERASVFGLIEETPDNRTSLHYWRVAYPRLSEFDQPRTVESSRRVLSFFQDEPLVRRFFDTPVNTLDIPDIVKSGKSLFCYLPDGYEEVTKVIGTFIANKFERVVYRGGRNWSERRPPYTLILDEFQHYCDHALAKVFAKLRKYGLRIVCSHHSITQEPFGTEEGQNLLSSIIEMAKTRVIFRVGFPTADRLVDELMTVTHNMEKRLELERATSDSYTNGMTESTGEGFSRNESQSEQTGVQFGTSSGGTHMYKLGHPLVYAQRGESGGESSQTRHSSSKTTGTQSMRTNLKADSHSSTHSDSTVEKIAYYTGEEERRFNITVLQSLLDRHCYVSTEALVGTEIVTLSLPPQDNVYLAQFSLYNGPMRLLEKQRARFIGALLPKESDTSKGAETQPRLKPDVEDDWDFYD